jgi:hypothetical protein
MKLAVLAVWAQAASETAPDTTMTVGEVWAAVQNQTPVQALVGFLIAVGISYAIVRLLLSEPDEAEESEASLVGTLVTTGVSQAWRWLSRKRRPPSKGTEPRPVIGMLIVLAVTVLFALMELARLVSFLVKSNFSFAAAT